MGVLNSCETFEMKSVCKVSVAFSSLTMRLKLSKLSRISRKTLFVSTCTRKLPPATSFIARDRREMGAKNAMEKPAAVALPSSSVKMSSHTNIGTLTPRCSSPQAASAASSATPIKPAMLMKKNCTRMSRNLLRRFFMCAPPYIPRRAS